ncbi:hypothetical protein [Pseudoxanthomonas putridarboris]|uniref:N-acetyltransferase domain-containing protein n=1 Tax=Pseudoxanthomonas putridarboris TaxID=752605 RepID=A0ABU9J0U8_9GAMM
MAAEPRPPPDFERTTRIFARALGWSPDELLARFRPAGEADLEALLAFRDRTGWDDEAYVRWRYGIGHGHEHAYGRLWIVRHEDGPVVAAIGTEVQPIRHAGVVHAGQLLMDVQLDPALEGAGGGAWLNQAMFGHADATLAVGGNTHSMGLVRRLFAPLPPRSHHVLPLDAAAVLRRRGTPAMLAAVVGPAMDVGWRIRNRVLASRSPRDIRVQEVASVSAEWLEPLYAALSPATACVAPGAAQLQWRLRDNPRAAYRLYIAMDGERCVGYLAARQTPVGVDGETGMHLIDWKLADGDAEAVLAALLSHVVPLARRQGCSKVFTTCLAPAAEGALERCGFLRGQPGAHLLTGIRTTTGLPTDARTPHWQITDLSFDSDGGY